MSERRHHLRPPYNANSRSPVPDFNTAAEHARVRSNRLDAMRWISGAGIVLGGLATIVALWGHNGRTSESTLKHLERGSANAMAPAFPHHEKQTPFVPTPGANETPESPEWPWGDLGAILSLGTLGASTVVYTIGRVKTSRAAGLPEGNPDRYVNAWKHQNTATQYDRPVHSKRSRKRKEQRYAPKVAKAAPGRRHLRQN